MNKKVVLITGGTRGIGYATAEKFGRLGYAVAINGTDEERGAIAVKGLEDKGIEALFVKCNVMYETEVDTMVDKVIEKFERLDVLVNNAGGLGGRQNINSMETSFWNNVINLNLTSVFYASRASIPYLKKQGGSIINLTSIAAYNGGGPGASAYAVAKSGVLALTRGMAKELISCGIRVNAVSPGTVDTDFHSATNKDLMNSWLKGIPAARFGTPEDVANIIYFLATDEASYLVGEVIQTNGGQDFR